MTSKPMHKPEISAENQIGMFMHCGKCLAAFKADLPEVHGESPESYARLSVGWTPRGIQVWCVRHDCNVINVDFEGHQHPAVTYRKADKPAPADKAEGDES